MENRWTYYLSEEGKSLGSEEGILPITLYKGMTITIHGHTPGNFEVVDWNYHHGQPDEKAGLKIILREK